MQFFKNLKHIFFISLLSLAILFGSVLLLFSDFLVPMNYFLIYRTGAGATFQDAIYRHSLEPSSNIVVVEIDEHTINTLQAKNELQMLSIPKEYYERLVRILRSYHARAIGFDIIFQNADSTEADFIATLEESNDVTIGTLSADKKELKCIEDVSGSAKTCEWTPRSNYKNIRWGLITLGENKLHAITQESRRGWYDITKNQEQREIKFAGRHQTDAQEKIIWSLPIAMLEWSDLPAYKSIIKNKMTPIMQPYFDVRDRNNGKPYVAISLIDLLEMPEVYAEKLTDAYVFVGESGDVIHDRFVSPATNEYRAGVYSHAFLLDAILQDKLLFKMHGDSSFALWIVLTIVSVIVYFFIPKFLSPFFALAGIVIIIFLTRWAYDAWRVVIDVLPLLLASSLLTYPATYIYKYFIVDRDKRVIVNTFSRYLSPSVVKMIDANSIEASLGGEKKELSILFSDIAGFTSIAEKMDTKDLFELMTKYLSKMTDILTDEHGTLDKYIGDAIMGFFGAPVEDPFHAIHACRTAIRMRKALSDINTELTSYQIWNLDFRVGIATGEVMVGNIGSEKRFNYTVLGDAVNLASRLEAIGKEYGVHIIIAASTRLIVGDEFLLRELDYIAVKGKDAGTRIYELIDTRDSGTDMSLYATYESALRLYREGKYLEAWQIFERTMEIDPPARVMAYRCLKILKGEMQLENGIYKMTHK